MKLDIVVDDAFKLLVDHVEFVYKEFKMEYIIVHDAFKLLIDIVKFVDKLKESVLCT
jgi:hypothetical protein